MALTPAQQAQAGLAQLRAQMAAQQAQRPVQNTMVPTPPGGAQTVVGQPAPPQRPVLQGVQAAGQPAPPRPAGLLQGVQTAGQPTNTPTRPTTPPPPQSTQPVTTQPNKPPKNPGAGNSGPGPVQLNPQQQAQLQRDLQSTNPQTKMAAQKIFAEVLKRDPNAMRQFQQQAAAGGPPIQLNPQQQAQLQRDLNSTDPQTKMAAQKIFKEMLKRDPAAMQQFAKDAAPASAPAGGKQGGAGATGPTYEDALGAQFGADNPFGVRELGGPNPLETAVTAAQRMLDENLAGTRSRFAAGGLGNSDRAALAEGQAIADTSTFLGDKLANIAENAYQNDAGRSLQAILGAAQNDLARSGLALQANQQLGGYGTGLTGIGAQETQIPNLGEILGTLAAFATSLGGGTSKGSGAQGFGWKR